jgi:NADH-quinone oxidoreductase subunit A
MANFTFIGILSIFALFMPLSALIAASLLRPKKPNPSKQSTYECGIETIGETWVQFKAQYYIYALIFVIFDIEAVFLLPFAVAYEALPLYAVVEAIIFILILGAALIYAWRTRAMRWL